MAKITADAAESDETNPAAGRYTTKKSERKRPFKARKFRKK
jgi:hypothetical protein